jgi:predicted nucleic acid-binding protein
MSGTDRTLLVDASVLITLSEVDAVDVLLATDGKIVIPTPVAFEVTDDPAASLISEALDAGHIETWDVGLSPVAKAASHLGKDLSDEELEGYGHPYVEGDIGLLALALLRDDPERRLDSPVVVTDDKPLRQTCKALSVPVSGSIGILVRAVERGAIEAEEAKNTLYAMDEVGARFSASLMKRAENLIDEAGD